MKINKQQRQVLILSGLLAVLAFTLYRWFAGSAGSPGYSAGGMFRIFRKPRPWI